MSIVTAAPRNAQFTRMSEGDSIELKDGRLLLVYMEFSGDGSDIAKTRFAAIESADGGKTWGGHRVVAETGSDELNIFSPNLVRAQDGGILLVFMRQFGHTPPIATQYAWKSSDEGKTFKPVCEFASKQMFSLCNAVIKRLSGGRLLLPSSVVAKSGDGPYSHTYDGAMLMSDDDGKTWREGKNRVSLPMRGVMEPHVEETRDGRVLMVMRSQLGSLFVSESKDKGETWSKPQVTGLRVPESCPEMTRIPRTGDLLMIWNNAEYNPGLSHYGKRTPLTAAVSRDEGRTWGLVRDIEADPNRAFSNPGCRFTRDGRAVVNYWTCEYLPDWGMQDKIDLRVAVLPTDWFYAKA
ncbi:MAG: sialidase family protein [Planctomycetota bacterium]|nr:sialidase family protein [Planctomycetota bacterium]